MNDNVVPINPPPKLGTESFLLCACDPADPKPFLIVAIVGPLPTISRLQCPACEVVLNVVYGQVQKP